MRGNYGSGWVGSPTSSGLVDFPPDPTGGPLSRLKDSVNSLEALNAMEKNLLGEQVCGSIRKLGFSRT